MTTAYPHWDFLPAMTNDAYYSDSFRAVLEDHLSLIQTTPGLCSIVNIDPHDAYKYESDLYGYLDAKSVPRHLFWVIMRLLGMVSPELFGPEYTFFYYPTETYLEQLRSLHTAVLGTG